MKITLTIIFLALIASINAQTYIRVSNNPNAIADYTNLQTAIDNASEDATIFVEPSTTSYGNASVTKRLTLLGGGYDAAKHNGKKSIIGVLDFSKLTGNPSGSMISGFYFSNIVGSYSYGVDSLTFQRCQFISRIYIKGSSADSISKWTIINCKIHQNIIATYSKNILISNNIIYSSVTGFNQYSVFITNNIFINAPGGNSLTSYSNNIFYSREPLNCSNCTFSHNLTSSSASTLDYGDNVATNNIEGIPTDNIFVTTGTDWHLKPTCPGVLAGSDGTDIGIYGGLYPFPEEDYGAIGFPQISTLNITNPVAEPNGTLKVNVKSKILD